VRRCRVLLIRLGHCPLGIAVRQAAEVGVA
jgi:hypothetical protein